MPSHSSDPGSKEVPLRVLYSSDIFSLVTYVREGYRHSRKHVDLIAAELIEIVRANDLTSEAIKALLVSGHPEVVAAVLKKAAAKGDQSTGSSLSEMQSEILVTDFSAVAPDNRIPLFETAKEALGGPKQMKHARHLVSDAITAQDIAFLQHIDPYLAKLPQEPIFFWQGFFSQKYSAFWPYLVRTLTTMDRKSPAVADCINGAIIRPNIYVMAAFIKSGVPVGPYLAKAKVQQGTWLDRLKIRTSTAHGEMTVCELAPPLDEIITVDQATLEDTICGISRKQMKKRIRHQRKAENAARQKALLG